MRKPGAMRPPASGGKGHCASPVSLLWCFLPRVGLPFLFSFFWGCLLCCRLLLVAVPVPSVGARSLLSSRFLRFAPACVAGFFAFRLVVPPLVFCGGSGVPVVRGVAFRLLAPRLGFAFGFARLRLRLWGFRLLAPSAGLLVSLVAFRLSPAFGVEGSPPSGGFFVRQGARLGFANGTRGLRRGGSHATASGRRHAGASLMGCAHAFFYRKNATLRFACISHAQRYAPSGLPV